MGADRCKVNDFSGINLDNPLYARQVRQVVADWKLTPATFAHKISEGSWIPGRWLMYLSAVLAREIAKGGARIIISAPPRHGKSLMTSTYLPAWLLERFPWMSVILATYGAELSVGFGRQVRDIFTDPNNAQLLNTKVRRDAGRVAAFKTQFGGGMYSVGLGGPITGRGAHVLLVDDYIKEIKEALSPAYRDYIWNWFVTTAYTRLEPNGSCIIIATRWHTDDLIGRLIADQPGRWKVITLPAIAEAQDLLPDSEVDIIGRKVGDPLFPERYSIADLLDRKEQLGSIFFDAMYQQRPVDESAKLTDEAWIKIIDGLPDMRKGKWKSMRMWDLAATPGGGDYTVGALCHYEMESKQFVIQNISRGQLSPEGAEEEVRSCAEKDATQGIMTVGIEREPGGSGKALVDHYDRNVLPEFKVIPIPSTTKKLIRAQPLLAAAEAGKVSIVRGPWNAAFLKEFDDFSGIDDHDDQIDTTGAAYSELSGKKVITVSWGRKTDVKRSRAQNSQATKQAGREIATKSRFEFRNRGATFGRRRQV